MDMTRIYREAARIHLPQALICYDPFHLIKWVGEALDQVQLATPRDGVPIQVDGLSPGKTWQKVRTTLRAAAENLDTTGKAIINQLRIRQKQLFSAWQLKENLRARYQGLSPKAGIRLIQRRANGYASLDNLLELIHMCHGGVPTRLLNHPSKLRNWPAR